jgi:hypothetical protein
MEKQKSLRPGKGRKLDDFRGTTLVGFPKNLVKPTYAQRTNILASW